MLCLLSQWIWSYTSSMSAKVRRMSWPAFQVMSAVHCVKGGELLIHMYVNGGWMECFTPGISNEVIICICNVICICNEVMICIRNVICICIDVMICVCSGIHKHLSWGVGEESCICDHVYAPGLPSLSALPLSLWWWGEASTLRGALGVPLSEAPESENGEPVLWAEVTEDSLLWAALRRTQIWSYKPAPYSWANTFFFLLSFSCL